MSLTENGLTTTKELGTENYEIFQTRVNGRYQWFVQYDYRHTNGALFSCVAPTLTEARRKRDLQLERGLIN